MSQNINACKLQSASRMTDYSEPLSNLPAVVSRLTVRLNERQYRAALATCDDVLRRMQVVRDWLIVEVEKGGEE